MSIEIKNLANKGSEILSLPSEITSIINSEINEIYITTNVLQVFCNETEEPLELKIYVYK